MIKFLHTQMALSLLKTEIPHTAAKTEDVNTETYPSRGHVSEVEFTKLSLRRNYGAECQKEGI